MSPSQILISNPVDKFLGMEEEEGLTHLLWLERNEGPSWISREVPQEISLILHPQGWAWSSTFQEQWRWKGNLGRKEHVQGWTIWTGIAMLWSYDAFHGCGESQDRHKLSCDLPWICPVASTLAYLWSINLQQMKQEYAMEKKEFL